MSKSKTQGDRGTLRIETRSVADLSNDPANARKHNETNIAAIVASLRRFGQQKPIVIDSNNVVRAGNGTLEAARQLGWDSIQCVVTSLKGSDAIAYAIADNRTAELAEWDDEILAAQLNGLLSESEEIALAAGFTAEEIEEMVALSEDDPEIVEDEAPEPPVDPITKPGDLWILGDHRLLCGDSTKAEDVARLMGGQKASLIHADPPYGMGKAAEGVVNDNLYGDDLDRFQMLWWKAFRNFLLDNASAYIWGNAPELWRLWYKAGLESTERLTLRSQIIWNKPPSASAYGSPIGSEKMRSYPHGYEVCLFFMIGEQGFNSNSENYWEGWEPLRGYLENEMKSLGWKASDLSRVTESFMGGHWVTKSQWMLPTSEQYRKIQLASNGRAFKREHDELKREHDELKRQFYETRAYFDNTHDNMTDVWDFNRVTGDDRCGHATPKPVSMMARVMMSSLPENGICVEPFGGSGSTLIGAQETNRICYCMEISPQYCDVIVARWEKLTGQKAVLSQ